MARVLVHSLLDRLIDDDPDRAVEQAEPEDVALARYKLGLRRDLEGLLNSKRPLLAATRQDDELGRTILGFGLADISTEDFSAIGARDRIRRMVAECIRDHEPRLSAVEVEVDGAPTSKGIRFRITAVLTLTRSRETVIYDASVRPSDRAIAVELSG
ncbi:type VI secretion system baseplate subunit TssE [Sphingomonas sp. MAH-20]|uniref:Type VI secretion system baseplate subunit TssE n=1 Tax=Sphingomonas horti TaxID=2682842 RepID=A0A6I4IZF9_9SPHN|nr:MULTISPECIES: type VI secretion system baseplate subunit TssE [Sphingomonas]MBA2920549.1 type VI secretion system baseplate subunit TssE [Sphingomonas sp. CGMCC 1.13658]MVO76801.1 type VI secretion system baseplate subunit TssE [Sphingomonas horti]